eukprot:CAMPEP_0114565584 /NCGR_PEP_ID=MMETSP0114-20121206/14390_1 /TAXON_ID=31324 /ORGANISM="Goniomonas sp, Strain m" /LENGTH=332 /DNA_ID=CAMNT_0001751845 /DNA_START=71 /DNA_END=1070 /DNA_ORIENTATION=+
MTLNMRDNNCSLRPSAWSFLSTMVMIGWQLCHWQFGRHKVVEEDSEIQVEEVDAATSSRSEDPSGKTCRFSTIPRLAIVVEGVAFLPGEIAPFENEYISGRIIVNSKPSSSPDSFGLQLQFTLLKPLRGTMVLGGEVPGEIELGFAARICAKITKRFLQLADARVHCCFGASNNEGERPHIVVPIDSGWSLNNYLTVTPPGETPPTLDAGASAMKGRRLECSELLPGHTYTLAFHNSTIDLDNWTVSTGTFSDVSLRAFWGSQPCNIAAYVIPEGQDSHAPELCTRLLEVGLIHSSLTAHQTLDLGTVRDIAPMPPGSLTAVPVWILVAPAD